MYVSKEIFINYKEIHFTFLIVDENITYGLDGRSNSILIIQNNGFYRKNTKRSYKRIAYDKQNKCFIGISNTKSEKNYIYKIDQDFNEFDCFSIQTECSSLYLEDIWYDNQLGIIYILSNNCIYKYNTIGDYLGIFLISHADKKLKAICSLDDIIFISYEKNNSSYVGKYTNQGAFLLELNLSADFIIHNMFISKKDDSCYLNIFATKKHCYQYFVEINFIQDIINNQDNDLEVKCVCEDENITSTCFVRQN